MALIDDYKYSQENLRDNRIFMREQARMEHIRDSAHSWAKENGIPYSEVLHDDLGLVGDITLDNNRF